MPESTDLEIQVQAEKEADDIILNALSEPFAVAKEHSGESSIKVIKSEIKEGAYGVGKKVHLTVKNVGEKTVDAIKLIGHYTDNWGEQVEHYILGSAHSYMEYQGTIGPGKQLQLETDLDHTGATKVDFVVTKIHFVEGHIWEPK